MLLDMLFSYLIKYVNLHEKKFFFSEYSVIFRTGDYARIDRGIVYYEGRTDSQIKIRGHRVDLSEVEKAFVNVAEVDKAVVLCYKPGELSQV